MSDTNKFYYSNFFDTTKYMQGYMQGYIHIFKSLLFHEYDTLITVPF